MACKKKTDVKKVNRQDLVKEIANKTGLKQKDVKEVIAAFEETIIEYLSKGYKVTLMNFGTWEIKERKERKGRNPQTGEEITIPATRVPKFTAGKNLKEAAKK